MVRGQIGRTGGKSAFFLHANNNSLLFEADVYPAVFDGGFQNRLNLLQSVIYFLLNRGFHGNVGRAFQGFQLGLFLGCCLFDFVEYGGLGRCRRELIENRAGTHGYFKDGHLALYAKRFRQFSSDLFELLCVDFRE